MIIATRTSFEEDNECGISQRECIRFKSLAQILGLWKITFLEIDSVKFDRLVVLGFAVVFLGIVVSSTHAQDATAKIEKLEVPNSEAAKPEEMKSYKEVIEHTTVTIEMLPVKGEPF